MVSVITDSDFKSFGTDASKWTLFTHEGIEVHPRLSDSVLFLNISKARGANWHAELRYSPFAVRKGDSFRISFSARARYPFSFSVWLGQQDAPYKSLVSRDNHFGEKMMTGEWQTFTHIWHPHLTEEAARLNFVFGQIDNVVELKGVSLTRESPLESA